MNAYKLLALSIAAAGVCSPVLAQSATTNVTVGVTLTSKCEFTSADLTFAPAYTAFQTAAVTASQNAAIKCTRGATAPTLTWNGGVAGAAATVGTVGGLTYQLTHTRGAFTGGAAPAGASASDLGTPDTATVVVDLLIPAAQAGTTGAVTPAARVLTVVF